MLQIKLHIYIKSIYFCELVWDLGTFQQDVEDWVWLKIFKAWSSSLEFLLVLNSFCWLIWDYFRLLSCGSCNVGVRFFLKLDDLNTRNRKESPLNFPVSGGLLFFVYFYTLGNDTSLNYLSYSSPPQLFKSIFIVFGVESFLRQVVGFDCVPFFLLVLFPLYPFRSNKISRIGSFPGLSRNIVLLAKCLIWQLFYIKDLTSLSPNISYLLVDFIPSFFWTVCLSITY